MSLSSLINNFTTPAVLYHTAFLSYSYNSKYACQFKRQTNKLAKKKYIKIRVGGGRGGGRESIEPTQKM